MGETSKVTLKRGSVILQEEFQDIIDQLSSNPLFRKYYETKNTSQIGMPRTQRSHSVADISSFTPTLQQHIQQSIQQLQSSRPVVVNPPLNNNNNNPMKRGREEEEEYPFKRIDNHGAPMDIEYLRRRGSMSHLQGCWETTLSPVDSSYPSKPSPYSHPNSSMHPPSHNQSHVHPHSHPHLQPHSQPHQNHSHGHLHSHSQESVYSQPPPYTTDPSYNSPSDPPSYYLPNPSPYYPPSHYPHSSHYTHASSNYPQQGYTNQTGGYGGNQPNHAGGYSHHPSPPPSEQSHNTPYDYDNSSPSSNSFNITSPGGTHHKPYPRPPYPTKPYSPSSSNSNPTPHNSNNGNVTYPPPSTSSPGQYYHHPSPNIPSAYKSPNNSSYQSPKRRKSINTSGNSISNNNPHHPSPNSQNDERNTDMNNTNNNNNNNNNNNGYNNEGYGINEAYSSYSPSPSSSYSPSSGPSSYPPPPPLPFDDPPSNSSHSADQHEDDVKGVKEAEEFITTGLSLPSPADPLPLDPFSFPLSPSDTSSLHFLNSSIGSLTNELHLQNRLYNNNDATNNDQQQQQHQNHNQQQHQQSSSSQINSREGNFDEPFDSLISSLSENSQPENDPHQHCSVDHHQHPSDPPSDSFINTTNQTLLSMMGEGINVRDRHPVDTSSNPHEPVSQSFSDPSADPIFRHYPPALGQPEAITDPYLLYASKVISERQSKLPAPPPSISSLPPPSLPPPSHPPPFPPYNKNFKNANQPIEHPSHPPPYPPSHPNLQNNPHINNHNMNINMNTINNNNNGNNNANHVNNNNNHYRRHSISHIPVGEFASDELKVTKWTNVTTTIAKKYQKGPEAGDNKSSESQSSNSTPGDVKLLMSKWKCTKFQM